MKKLWVSLLGKYINKKYEKEIDRHFIFFILDSLSLLFMMMAYIYVVVLLSLPIWVNFLDLDPFTMKALYIVSFIIMGMVLFVALVHFVFQEGERNGIIETAWLNFIHNRKYFIKLGDDDGN